MKILNLQQVKLIAGILTIIVGIPYVLGFYGPTETEVVYWGMLSMIMGGVMLGFAIEIKPLKILTKVTALVILLMQIPPIILWFTFYGKGISDGIPQSNFVAHWIFSVPHIIVGLLCLYLVIPVFSKQKNQHKEPPPVVYSSEK